MNFLKSLTDKVSTKKGAWMTVVIWLVLMIVMSAGPKLGDYKVSNFQSLPDEAQSIITQNQLDQYFPTDQGTPGIYVFYKPDGKLAIEDVIMIIEEIKEANIEGIEKIVDISKLPPHALRAFLSEDETTMIVPMNLKAGLGNADYAEINEETTEVGRNIAEKLNIEFYITGPAGIAGDTVRLFESADLNLLFATIGIILVLLIGIYRSPLLAMIPLLATVVVYQVVNQTVALLGAGGLEINNSTASIMSILLFAAVVDYSLFVFSRYREELNHYEDQYEAMKAAIGATAEPVLFAGGTVFAAMIILYFADFREYQNFAPVFATAMVIIMIASVTLIPALFALFGRKAFWPKVPKYGETKEVKHGIWGPVAKFVVGKPFLAGGVVLLFLIVTALNIFNLNYEFNMVKGFPEDLPSRRGFEIVEEKFNKGDLAQTTVLVSGDQLTQEDLQEISAAFTENEHISSSRPSGLTENGKYGKITVSLRDNPYSIEAIEFLEKFREDYSTFRLSNNKEVQLSYAGVTAKLVDEQQVNNSDIKKIVTLETILILALLFFLTRSIKMPIYMMATILISYLSALGLGIFLVDVIFGFDAISTRAPVYAFIFLVALGIDYNIILVSRFFEERKTLKVKDALEVAIRNTGGVISSAGVILAATFAALITMPITDLSIFGFIVAIGIIMDTFLVRGMLLPSLILFFEKDKTRPLKGAV
ncbi:MMPL family transporter [Calidifontibacillus erzurumensis]|uniref:MMPL family transporter n=1 Tax=Calidifontibacillus erzurumensis TaxID=2741433 RepID=A0A8J8KCQ0_9BACI|nr:MMPL family transporter [Calidifontibacillus erzurumensis]NSL52852.1 MMPL family transporter [Calidifontibacillus erzurumensis]